MVNLDMMESKQSQAEKLPDFAKYGKIPALLSSEEVDGIGGNLEVFEKIDGGNCQIRNVKRWNLLRGSKGHFIKGKNYSGYREWFNRLTAWTYSNPSLYNLPGNMVLFGEWSGNHRINYAPEYTDKFFSIDLYSLRKGRFMEYEKGRDFLERLGVKDTKFLDVLARGKVTSRDIESLLKEPSSYYDGPKEGLVIKDYTNQKFYKIYHPNFAESVREKSGHINYLTDARFLKVFFELLEEGRDVSFESLCSAVISNIRIEDSVTYSPSEVRNTLKEALSREELGRFVGSLLD